MRPVCASSNPYSRLLLTSFVYLNLFVSLEEEGPLIKEIQRILPELRIICFVWYTKERFILFKDAIKTFSQPNFPKYSKLYNRNRKILVREYT